MSNPTQYQKTLKENFKHEFLHCQRQLRKFTRDGFGIPRNIFRLIGHNEKDGGCTFYQNALRSEIVRKASGRLLKDRHKAGG